MPSVADEPQPIGCSASEVEGEGVCEEVPDGVDELVEVLDAVCELVIVWDAVEVLEGVLELVAVRVGVGLGVKLLVTLGVSAARGTEKKIRHIQNTAITARVDIENRTMAFHNLE